MFNNPGSEMYSIKTGRESYKERFEINDIQISGQFPRKTLLALGLV